MLLRNCSWINPITLVCYLGYEPRISPNVAVSTHFTKKIRSQTVTKRKYKATKDSSNNTLMSTSNHDEEIHLLTSQFNKSVSIHQLSMTSLQTIRQAILGFTHYNIKYIIYSELLQPTFLATCHVVDVVTWISTILVTSFRTMRQCYKFYFIGYLWPVLNFWCAFVWFSEIWRN